jgi:hypothetical protein
MGVLMRRWLGLGLVPILAACSSGTDGSPPAGSFVPTPAEARTVALADGSRGLAWGSGAYGVVLLGDGAPPSAWSGVAPALAEHGMQIVALDEATPAALRAAVTWLRGQGAARDAVMTTGASFEAAFAVGRSDPTLIDQLIAISADGDAATLGAFPKYFVAAEGEAAAGAATRMANEAPGQWNAELLVPGSEGGLTVFVGPAGPATLDAIIRRLEERR